MKKLAVVALSALLGLASCGGTESGTVARTKNAAITTTSIGAPACAVRVRGYVVTPCRPYTSMKTEWYDSTKKIVNAYSSKSWQVAQLTHTLTSSWLGGNPTRAYVTYTLDDGGSIGPFFVPYSASTNVTLSINYSSPATTTTTTLPIDTANCVLSVQNNVITPCRKFTSDSIQWWNDTRALSGTTGGSTVTPRSSLDLGSEYPSAGSTRVLVTFTFPDGASTQSVYVPFPAVSPITVKAPMIAAPTTTTSTSTTLAPYNCVLTVRARTVTPCKQMKSVSYQWWNDTKAISGTLSSFFNQYSPISFDLGAAFPNNGTTQALVSFVLVDGKSTQAVLVPMSGGTTQVSTMAR